MQRSSGTWRKTMWSKTTTASVMFQGLVAAAIGALAIIVSYADIGGAQSLTSAADSAQTPPPGQHTEAGSAASARSSASTRLALAPPSSPPDAASTHQRSHIVTSAVIDTPARTTKVAGGATSPVPSSDNAGINQLGYAELLAIKVPEFAGLTGEYRINADDTISVPVIGRVTIAGLTAPQLESNLVQALVGATGRQAHVTVEIAKYKPVFVTGYVMRPGSFPWSPGMNILQAEAKAGGVFRPTDRTAGSPTSDGELFRIQRTVNDLKRVLATLARLKAEQEERPSVTIPARLVELVGRLEAEKLIDAQSSALKSRRAAFKAQVEALHRGVATGEQELVALRAQRERINEQVAARRALTRKLAELQNKRLVRIDRILDEQAKLANLEEKVTNVVVATSRIQGTILGMQRDIVNLKYAREATVDTETFKLERDASQFEIELDAARRAHHVATTGSAMPESRAMHLNYEIVRSNGSTQKLTRADRFAALHPGDTVIVKPTAEPAVMPTR